MQVPLMFAGSSQLVVSERYICSLVEQANSKMHTNWGRVKRFLELLRQDAWQHPAAPQVMATQAQHHTGDRHAMPAVPYPERCSE